MLEKPSIEHGPAVEKMPIKHLLEYREAAADLEKAAKAARDKMAYSYRDFRVGCALLAWHEQKKEYFVYTAGNFKPQAADEHGVDKRCAERNTIDAAENDGCTTIIAIVIASNRLQRDSESGHSGSTLHPCSECRNLFKQKSNLVKGYTIVRTINDTPEETTDANVAEWIEEVSVNDLLATHGNK